MVFKTILISVAVVLLHSLEISAHGRLMEPVARSSAWRKGFKTPKNYNDNELYCGGLSVQQNQNKGKCGACGDNYAKPQPRDNENGGKYGTGKIVQRYTRGQKIKIQVQITANHKGYFEFSLCPLNSTKQLETEECFAANPITLTGGSYRYPVKGGILGYFNISAQLPPGLTCEHCVLRWHYYCGNNWGICPDGTGKLGCGPQETFRGCADVSIRDKTRRVDNVCSV